MGHMPELRLRVYVMGMYVSDRAAFGSALWVSSSWCRTCIG